MKKLLVGAAVAVLALTVVPAIAQTPPPPGVAQGTAPVAPVTPVRPMRPTPEMRSHVMVMSDRVMTRDEAVRHVRAMFAKLDTNRDGVVTRQEVDALHQKMMGAMGAAGDMQRRLAERGILMGDRATIFDRLDTNHDGSISRQEFMAGHGQVDRQRVMILHGDAVGSGMPGEMGMELERMRMHMRSAGMSRGFGGHLFDMADANHDGRVTLQEAEAAALAHFDKADINHDGRITPDERQQIRQLRIERRQS